jgi:hypothetical protein
MSTAEVVRRIRASFDRSVDGYQIGTKFQLSVSFKLAATRRR